MLNSSSKNHNGTAGVHILAEYMGCDRRILRDRDLLEKLLQTAADATGATIIKKRTLEKQEGGFLCILVLQESHISLHSWPEKRYVAADIFTCGDCIPENAMLALKEGLKASEAHTMVVDRGLSGDHSVKVAGYRPIDRKSLDCRDASLPKTIKVEKSSGRGLGLFCTKSIKSGEIIYKTEMWLESFDTEFVMITDKGESVLSADELGSELTTPDIGEFPSNIRSEIIKHYSLQTTDSDAILRDHLTDGGEKEVLVTTFDGLMNHSSNPNITVDPEIRNVNFESGYPVWTICILAKRDIEEGDELFWDYSEAGGFIPPNDWV